MKILYNNIDLNKTLKNVSKLGFVPTMGYLHGGHISLIKKSINKCNRTIVSIFVNPTQFNNQKDFKRYPRNIKKDLKILKKLKVNFVYIPRVEHIYNFQKKNKIKLDIKDKILCAKFRKGHFEGVIDVMSRFIYLIKPHKIFMGEKDYQQLYLIKKYIKNKYKSTIISCKTTRDTKKLALSSRNVHLTKKQLTYAGKLAQDLIYFKKNLFKKKNIQKLIKLKKNLLEKLYNINIEYLELRNKFNLKKTNKINNSKLFIAYYINKIRLIDNF